MYKKYIFVYPDYPLLPALVYLTIIPLGQVSINLLVQHDHTNDPNRALCRQKKNLKKPDENLPVWLIFKESDLQRTTTTLSKSSLLLIALTVKSVFPHPEYQK